MAHDSIQNLNFAKFWHLSKGVILDKLNKMTILPNFWILGIIESTNKSSTKNWHTGWYVSFVFNQMSDLLLFDLNIVRAYRLNLNLPFSELLNIDDSKIGVGWWEHILMLDFGYITNSCLCAVHMANDLKFNEFLIWYCNSNNINFTFNLLVECVRTST